MKVDVSLKLNLDVAKVVRTVSDESLGAVDQACQLVVREAKVLSPFEEGTNRRSIEHEVKATPSGPQGEVYTTSGYGGFLEIGVGRRRSKEEQRTNSPGTGESTRFMYPAFEKVRSAIVECFEGIVK